MAEELKDQTQAVAQEAAPEKREIIVELSGSRKAKVVKGKGIHSRKAQRLVEKGNFEESYKFALMAMVTTVDDKEISPQDLDEMDLDDFHQLQAAFYELNF